MDRGKVYALAARIANEVDIQPIEAGLAMENGAIMLIEDVAGRVVDQAAPAEQIATAPLALESATLQVPLVSRQPKVEAEDNAEAQRQAEGIISGNVVVTDGDTNGRFRQTISLPRSRKTTYRCEPIGRST